MDYTVHGILQARILKWVAYPSPALLLNPGIELGSPALQVDSFPSEPWLTVILESIISTEFYDLKSFLSNLTDMC